MKKAEWQQLGKKSATELAAQIKAMHQRISALQLEKAAGKLKNVHAVRQLRRDLARLYTLHTAKETHGETSEN